MGIGAAPEDQAFWTARRIELKAWLHRHAPGLANMYEGAVRLMFGAPVPGHGAKLGRGAEVRINGVVHLRSHLPPEATVPIGWVAVGDPIRIFPPDKHEEIWAVQKPLNFPLHVCGFDRGEADMRKITTRLCNELGEHRNDAVSGAV